MANVTFQGNAVKTIGELPDVGSKAIDFVLVKSDLSEGSLNDFLGKRIVLNIFPSIDTPVCAQSVRHFNQAAVKKDNVVVLCISQDLPFAQSRFCGSEGLDNVITLSSFRATDFGRQYGVTITTSVLTGLLARAVVLIDEKGQISYTELVSEITQEPNYEAVLGML